MDSEERRGRQRERERETEREGEREGGREEKLNVATNLHSEYI